MFGGLANENGVRDRSESVEVFFELVLIELFKAFVLVLTVVGEAIDGFLRSLVFRIALIDEGDSVLHGEVVDRSNVIEFLVHNSESFL